MTKEKCEKFNLVIVGDNTAGKSSLHSRFLHDQFSDEYLRSTDREEGVRYIEIDNKIIKLNVRIEQKYINQRINPYRNANGVMIVYDITDQDSFAHVRCYIREVLRFCNHYEFGTMIIVGNKNDLQSIRQVQFEAAKAIADEYSFYFMETSAKTGENAQKAFIKLVSLASKNLHEKYKTKSKQSNLGAPAQTSKKTKEKNCIVA